MQGRIGVLTVTALALVTAPAAAQTPGTLDTSFDSDGKVTTPIGGGHDEAHAVALQPDGRIIVAGFSESGTGRRFAVARYQPDGSLDPTFDGDGRVTLPPIGSGSRDEAYAVALQPDGRIVLAGDGWGADGFPHFAVARLNADGSLDADFDGDGIVATPFGAKGTLRGVAVQADGKIMVAGNAAPDTGSGGWGALVRYNSDGSLDPTFNDDDRLPTPPGIVVTDVGSSSVYFAVAVRSDGRIVATGRTHAGNFEMLVVRYESSGARDASFGPVGTTQAGVVITSVGTGVDSSQALDLLDDGRIVTAGFAQVSGFQLAVVRYRENGALDPLFGGDGIVTTPIGSLAQGFGVALDPDGRALVAGEGTAGTDRNFALARYGTDGGLDGGFGTGGVVTTPFGSAVDSGRAIALQPDGRILVAGNTDSGGFAQGDFAIARYHGDPPADITPPTIECGSPDGAWHPTDVSIACAASDAESGLADPGDETFSLATSVTVGTEDANASTGSRQVCDRVGNCATAGPISGNMVDKSDPLVSIVRPGAETYLLNEPVLASYSCTDGGSGISSCSGPVADGASLDTASVGRKSFIVSATDGVGNEASETVAFHVAFDVFLLYEPAEPTRKIKLRLHDALGANVSSPATALTPESIDGSTAAGGTFDYSNGADGYVYRVKADGLGSGSHTLQFTAGGEPTVYSVPFMVR